LSSIVVLPPPVVVPPPPGFTFKDTDPNEGPRIIETPVPAGVAITDAERAVEAVTAGLVVFKVPDANAADTTNKKPTAIIKCFFIICFLYLMLGKKTKSTPMVQDVRNIQRTIKWWRH
jgi:hypothetical protein